MSMPTATMSFILQYIWHWFFSITPYSSWRKETSQAETREAAQATLGSIVIEVSHLRAATQILSHHALQNNSGSQTFDETDKPC